jgi:hypothetical protein
MHRPFLHKSTPRSKTSDALYSFDWRGVRASRYGYPLIRFSRFHVHPVQSGKSKSEVILLQLHRVFQELAERLTSFRR